MFHTHNPDRGDPDLLQVSFSGFQFDSHEDQNGSFFSPLLDYQSFCSIRAPVFPQKLACKFNQTTFNLESKSLFPSWHAQGLDRISEIK